jgi:hypothetical protein
MVKVSRAFKENVIHTQYFILDFPFCEIGYFILNQIPEIVPQLTLPRLHRLLYKIGTYITKRRQSEKKIIVKY